MEKCENHYKYLDLVLPDFFKKVGINWDWNADIVGAHGDKGYGYKDKWEKHRIPFHKGMAVYLMTYCRPYAKEVRETEQGWVDPSDWVIENYEKFEHFLP